MNTSRSSACVFCAFRQTIKIATPRRKFHAAPSQLHPRRRETTIERPKLIKENIKPYSEEERKILRERYSEAQIAALEAGESSISPEDLVNQASRRTDHWSLRYFDDLSKIDAVVDEPERAPYSNFDPNSRLKSEEELDREFGQLLDGLPPNATFKDYKDLDMRVRLTTGKEEAERNPRSALASALFEENEMFNSEGEVVTRKKTAPKKQDGGRANREEEATPAIMRLMQMTGYDQRQISGFRVKTIITHGVVNQTRLGKIRKQYFLTIAGNQNGLIGIGEAKAEETNEARLQSQYRAIRNMRPILRYEKRTIFGDVKGKVGATELEIFNRPPGKLYSFAQVFFANRSLSTGFGLRCSHHIWEIAKCAGLSDLAARVTRARNPMNTVKAAVQALTSQKDPEDVARARGKKMVDVRKVYYAGGLIS